MGAGSQVRGKISPYRGLFSLGANNRKSLSYVMLNEVPRSIHRAVHTALCRRDWEASRLPTLETLQPSPVGDLTEDYTQQKTVEATVLRLTIASTSIRMSPGLGKI